ncbi:MAG: primosomal protein N' [Bacteroidota bacterium]
MAYSTHSPGTTHFVDLILPLAIPKLLTYRVPTQWSAAVGCGSRVLVPLGAKKIVTGLVENIHQTPPSYATKDILTVLDQEPLVRDVQRQFFHWLAHYYLCTIGEVLKAALPSGFRLSSQAKIQLNPACDLATTNFSDQEQHLIKVLKSRPHWTYAEVTQVAKQKNIPHLIKNLLHKYAILLFEEIQEKYRPKKEKRISLNTSFIQSEAKLRELFEQLEAKSNQLEVLLKYISLVPQFRQLADRSVNKKELLQAGISARSLQKLIQQAIFMEEEIIVSRLAPSQPTETPHATLSPAQSEALEAIYQQFKTQDTVLLYGITGSGKTALYTQLIQDTLQQGGQVLYLLPEIGLATQIVRRLAKQFGSQLGVYHSKYASNERVEVWNQVLSGTYSLIIGARSALLLPFDNLRLIIVDEEHAQAYKQFDTAPRYHARDAALMLAQYHHAKVLLGSATPSVETYYHAQTGKYGLVKLVERFRETALPQMVLVNGLLEQRRKKLQGEFTSVLIHAIEQTLSQQAQVIIFQNRRGYAPYLLCQSCAWVPTCQQCAVSLTYHQASNYLVCHYCGYRTKVPPMCKVCGAHQLKNMGFGTEKLEETLQQFFPDKQVQRMDLDTTRGKHSYEQIIDALEQGHADILVGTQMITKGLDFAQVSLVGILDIDRLLHFPDFRAHERCFQLITQVGGRAGRRDKQGRVIIQTNNPSHPVLSDIVQHNYEQMYYRELAERRQFLYPPYVRLVKLTTQHTDKDLVTAAAQELVHKLKEQLGKLVLGPQAPLIAKLKHQYRMDIWVKVRKDSSQHLLATKKLLQEATQALLGQKAFRTLKVILDVDPG